MLKDCFLPGTNFSGVLPEENDDGMFCCNKSMKMKDQNVWIIYIKKPAFVMLPVNEEIKQNEESFYIKELMITMNFNKKQNLFQKWSTDT